MNLTANNLAERVFHEAGVMLVVLDPAGAVLAMNRAACTAVHAAADEVAGKNWFDLFVPAEAQNAARAAFAGLLASHDLGAVCCESPIVATTGQKRTIQWHHTIVRDIREKIAAVACAGIDITAQKQLETRLVEAKERAEKANRAKDDFLTLMSHELRTPLTSIIGFSELLHQRASSRAGAASFEPASRILANGHALLHLVNNILDLTRIEAGSLDLASEEADLREILDECEKVVAPLLADKPVVFSHTMPKHVPAIHTDRNRLRQVLLNIIGNAIKFTEKGSITLTLKVIYGARLPIRIQVADTGIGIPEERIGRIFERFSRDQQVLTRKFGGSGIGLAVSRAIVRQMGGAIEVRSTPGKGSLFTLMLPRKSKAFGAPVSSGESLPVPPAPLAATSPAHASIVVVDDDDGSRELMYHILRREGFTAITLLSGGQEIRKITAANPALILVDLNMPFISGQRLLRSIRKRRVLAAVKCIAVTAYATDNGREQCLRLGFDDFLAKPFTPHELVLAVKKALHCV